jgi:hypothetical protein
MKRLLVVAVVTIVAISVSGCSWPRCFSRGDSCSGGGAGYEARMIDSQVYDGQIVDGPMMGERVIDGGIGELVEPGPRGNP